MRTTKKILSLILTFVMVLGLLPATVFATGGEDVVYLSISFDSRYIDDKNGNPIAYIPIPMSAIEAIDLTEYGLDNMLFDADGDGEYETTALQLLIYAHEELYGGDWSEVTFDALPGSSYFRGGIFGFTENLVYFQNGDFPVDESQQSDFMTVGATSDRIVLEAGDFLDVASFSCYQFLWDQLGGFHLFADENGNYTHDYAVDAGEVLDIKLKHSFCDLMFGESWVKDAEDYEVYYGAEFGVAEGSVTTDGEGNAQITFSNAGTYYIWCDGGNGSEDGTHIACDHYSETGEPCIVSSPAFAKVTVIVATAPEVPRQPQDVSAVLSATLAMQATTVAEPSFGTNYGEWTVFGLARGGYYANDSRYFADYYDRIVEYVNEKAAEINLSGALDKNKSTDNSRLIMALAAIGRDATSVGDWDLVEAYSANGINWIKRQGMNGTIWTLIALDCGGYETSDPTIRQQCVDAIVNAQHNDGGWSLVTAKTQPSNVDITGMTLTALYPYRDQSAVAEACEKAFTWLSESQLDNGGFPYGQGETSESCVWAIVACTTWGINPDTDPRFIKNGNSAIDNLLTYYIAAEAKFEHGRGAGANAMATDQATYGLVAYQRLVNGKSGLYDYSDVTKVVPETPAPETPTPDEPTPDTPVMPPMTEKFSASLTLPVITDNTPGTTFEGVLSINGWNKDAGYKLMDLVIIVPDGLVVENVVASNRLSGGKLEYHYSEDSGKLRIVYVDLGGNQNLNISGTSFPAELFAITFRMKYAAVGSNLNIGISDMTIKVSSAEDSATIVQTENAQGSVFVFPGIRAAEIYRGDGTELIPADKKAVVISISTVAKESCKHVVFSDASHEIIFRYSAEITENLGVASYVALVDASIPLDAFEKAANYVIGQDQASQLVFGDINGDGLVNAQDALAAVNAWLRKGEALTQSQMLAANVNGDAHVDTYDALGIIEAFIYNDKAYAVITKVSKGFGK